MKKIIDITDLKVEKINPNAMKALRPYCFTKETASKYKEKAVKNRIITNKRKRELKEQLTLAIDIYTKKELKKKRLTEQEKEILKNTNIIVLKTMDLALNEKYDPRVRSNMLLAILDRVHGKIADKDDNPNDGEERIVFIDEEQKKRLEEHISNFIKE